MSGSVLGQDQINKVNALYVTLLAHVRALLAADRTPYGLMKVHFLVEGLDSTEMHRIFSQLTFLSPTEKRALVRAAIYDILTASPGDLKADISAVPVTVDTTAKESVTGSVLAKEFAPPQFRLNPATVTHIKEERV